MDALMSCRSICWLTALTCASARRNLGIFNQTGSAYETPVNFLMKLAPKVRHPLEPVPGTRITGGFCPYVNVEGMYMTCRRAASVRSYGASEVDFLGKIGVEGFLRLLLTSELQPAE
jgi:hypothetical protein